MFHATAIRHDNEAVVRRGATPTELADNCRGLCARTLVLTAELSSPAAVRELIAQLPVLAECLAMEPVAGGSTRAAVADARALVTAGRRPTSHYHVGAGVAWAKRRPGSRAQCAATLPWGQFDRLQGGALYTPEGPPDLVALRIYPDTPAALAALAGAPPQ